jgi:predicted DNA-binding transcriptional regulator AlpA
VEAEHRGSAAQQSRHRRSAKLHRIRSSNLSVKEAAEIAGVQRSNFVRDYASKQGFPAPVCELATGRIWRRSEVEDYLAAKMAKSRSRQLAL